MVRRVVQLREVAQSRRQQRAKRVRSELFAGARRAMDLMGEDLAGFALVAFDHRGDAFTTYALHRDCHLGESLLPAAAGDALSRHVAVDLAEREICGRDPEDDGA